MGFPHSEMSGSPFATNSPDLIAGNRVLHRPQAPRHSPCALCSLTYFFSIQPGPRTGRTDACGSPIHTIGTISLLAKLAICLPLHLLRCTTRSFELAREQTRACAGSNKPVKASVDRLRPPAGGIPARTTNHTAKRPMLAIRVEPRRLELLTSALQRRRSTN